MDNNVLPIIFQHVRELAELQMGRAESDRYKLITPFPPVGNDFIDFRKENLEFSDPQTDSDIARADVRNAYEFFYGTDNLFYDYSYGIKSQEHFLSHVCKKFYGDAVFVTEDDNFFIESFKNKKDAFLSAARKTVGDIGQSDFYFTSLSPVQWNIGKVAMNEGDVKRLKEKALSVYGTIGNIDSDYVKVLLNEIERAVYNTIDYEFGFFDVLRDWVDPRLFESTGWKFRTDTNALYAEGDSDFSSNETRLCYAQRFYVIKNYSGKKPHPAVSSAAMMPPVGDMLSGRSFLSPIRTIRTDIRDRQLRRKVEQIRNHRIVRDHRDRTNPPVPRRDPNAKYEFVDGRWQRRRVVVTQPDPAPVDPTGKFVWIPATPTTPGHWERKRANAPPPPPPEPVEPEEDVIPVGSIYKIAAVKCRIIPWKPPSLRPSEPKPADPG